MRPSSLASLLALAPAASVLVLVALGVAAPGRAQVAVVTTLPEPDPGQRDVAAGIVAVAAERWQLLSPPLDPDVTAACKTDTACMLQAARARGATHLLVASVAGVGRRDHVVALQVLDAGGRVLLDNTAIVPGGGNPYDVGTSAAAVLTRVDGPPRTVALPVASAGTTTQTPQTTTRAPTTGWTTAGVSLIAAGALTATSTSLLAASGAVPSKDAVVFTTVSASAAGLLAVLGLVCVVLDDGG